MRKRKLIKLELPMDGAVILLDILKQVIATGCMTREQERILIQMINQLNG